ncbi:MAG TPA: hypothetical protein VGP25_04885 [Gemmatimonadaceae bacterium]|nr:hypothetical protein [Gemmatimonadaceae bacterium]
MSIGGDMHGEAAVNKTLGYGLLLMCAWSRVGHAQSLPTLRGQSLAGGVVSLPSDLNGRVGIFVVGFSRRSAESGKGWGKAIAEAYAHDPQVAYYDVPVLAAVPSFMRGAVLRRMRRSIPAADQAHVVPVLQDAASWKDAVHFGAADDAYIVVVNRTGGIEWRMHGFMTPVSRLALIDTVRALEARTAVAGRRVHLAGSLGVAALTLY